MNWSSVVDLTQLNADILTIGGLLIGVSVGLYTFYKVKGMFMGR